MDYLVVKSGKTKSELKNLRRRLSKFFDPSSGTSSLWSVLMVNFIPKMYVENLGEILLKLP